MPESCPASVLPDKNRELLHEKIKWLMLFRVTVAVILIVASVLAQFREQGTFLNSITSTFYSVAGIVFFLSLLYVPLLRVVKDLLKVAYLQIFVDIALITAVIYISGGISSPFSLLYILTVIAATIVSYRKGGYWAASLSSILYGSLVNVEYYNILPSMNELLTGLPQQIPRNILYNTASNIAAFYLVAFLSGYLAAQTRRVEEELREKKIDYQALEALNNDIVKNISSGLMTVDNNGKITSFNTSAERITGYSLEGVYGRNLLDFFPDLKGRLRRNGAQASSSANEGWESWFRGAAGEDYYLGFSISPLMASEGEKAGDIIIFQDLTELNRMEGELKKADRLAVVGSFAAGIAHEIRNPLAAISGSIEILSKPNKEGENRNDSRLMEIVLREVERLNFLITEFLNYARPPAPEREEVDINSLIAETIELFANSECAEKDIELKSRFGDIPLILLDRGQMKQVLWNLMKNSAEAIEKKGKIEIETRRRSGSESDMAEIIIRDSGCGISPGTVMHVFDPFYTSKEKGTGLGLSIVHNIIEAHGASIDLESKPGKGTIFIIRVPIR